MPIGGSTRVGTGNFADPKMIPSLVKQGWFPYHCTMQIDKPGRTNLGSIAHNWKNVDGYTDLPCRKFDRLPHEDRTLEIIEEIKYWTIMLGGFYPKIDPAWRVLVKETNEIFNIEGVDSDSLHQTTVITCIAFLPLVEPGT